MGVLYSRYFTTRNQIGLMLFFTYIYDLLRTGYLESKQKRQAHHSAMISYLQHASLPPLNLNRLVDHHSYSHPSSSCNLQSLMTTACQFKDKIMQQKSRQQGQRRRRYGSLCLKAIDQFGRDFVRRVASPFKPLTAAVDTTTVESGDDVNQTGKLNEPVASLELDDTITRTSSFEAFVEPANYLNGNYFFDSSQSDDSIEDDDCPLREMHKFARAYQYFSHLMVSFTFVKYLLLNIFYAELFGTKKVYSCYLPGRTYVLTRWSPGFTFCIVSYHVIYRIYLCLIRKSFNIDTFFFVLYDEQHIVALESAYKSIKQRQQRLSRHTKKSVDSIELYKLVTANRMFFIETQLPNKTQTYQLKINRRHKNWCRLKDFINKFFLLAMSNFIIWTVPLGAIFMIQASVLAQENNEILYSHCNQLSDEVNPSKWTTSINWQRIVWLIFDAIDNAWLLFDTANGLAWPFAILIVCAQDINYGLLDVAKSIGSITLRLHHWLSSSHDHDTTDTPTRTVLGGKSESHRVHVDNRARRSALASIHDDMHTLQCDINYMLRQTGEVDEFVSKLSLFVIFSWLSINTYYQLVSLTQHNQLVELRAIVQYMQIIGLCAITCTFVFLSRTHTISQNIYHGICQLAAMDPDHTTKSGWLPILEYYHKNKPRCSFHLGPWAQLTLSNYLKSMAWLITSAVFVVSLYKLNSNTAI